MSMHMNGAKEIWSIPIAIAKAEWKPVIVSLCAMLVVNYEPSFTEQS